MPASFVVYIDESGDEGFVFNPDRTGSSHWFVLAAVVTRKPLDLETVKLVDKVRAKLNYQRKPLHFRKMKHDHRLPYIDQIATARVRVLAVAVYKPLLKEQEKFRRKSVLYHYTARLLLERVSWCCRDHRTADSGDGTSEIIFSNRSGTSYDELRDYFQRLEQRTQLDDVQVDWSAIDPSSVRAMNHDSMMGLQIADACASAFYFGLQSTPQGFSEPRYASMLKPVVYRHHGRQLGYGLKLWPREIDSILDGEKSLQWVKEVYK